MWLSGRGDRDQAKFETGVAGENIHCYPIGDRIVALPDREMISASLVRGYSTQSRAKEGDLKSTLNASRSRNTIVCLVGPVT
jgi:hypothetical protein